MAQVKGMKEALENTYTFFKQKLSALTRTSAAATSSTRNIQSKLDALTEALDNLNTAHTSWKVKAGLSEDELSLEEYSDTWLQARWEEADLQIDIANDALHLAAENANNRLIARSGLQPNESFWKSV